MSANEPPPIVSKPPCDAKKQWQRVIAVRAVQRLLNDARKRAADTEDFYEASSGDHSVVDIPPHAKSTFQRKQLPRLEIPAQNPNLDISVVDTRLDIPATPNPDDGNSTYGIDGDELQLLKVVHHALVQQLNSYGIVLTLLASVSFVAILQPPGSFDDRGNMRSPILVGCFMFFATLSFLLAATGLLAVVLGTASLFRPGFFLKFEPNLRVLLNPRVLLKGKDTGGEVADDTDSEDAVELDDLSVLGCFVLDNLHRTWRLRIYLNLSLLLCVAAFGCGAFAIVGSGYINWCLLVGAISLGVVALAVEFFKTGAGLTTYHSSKWLWIFRQKLPSLRGRRQPPSGHGLQATVTTRITSIVRGITTKMTPTASRAHTPRAPCDPSPRHFSSVNLPTTDPFKRP